MKFSQLSQSLRGPHSSPVYVCVCVSVFLLFLDSSTLPHCCQCPTSDTDWTQLSAVPAWITFSSLLNRSCLDQYSELLFYLHTLRDTTLHGHVIVQWDVSVKLYAFFVFFHILKWKSNFKLSLFCHSSADLLTYTLMLTFIFNLASKWHSDHLRDWKRKLAPIQWKKPKYRTPNQMAIFQSVVSVQCTLIIYIFFLHLRGFSG